MACQAFWKKVFERQIEDGKTIHSDSEYIVFETKSHWKDYAVDSDR
ncbi:transport protein particle (TRAPP) component domain protein [Leptospira broomii serovar Hurstbridge str. 5399]|uniref:Transport protein particle (TRAPP) component domain protein n=1 Tax=Leptospira broomii serovar Hurstbridge str. 5399 TaxID=1049789 RepID=T0GCA6_9LEPT|nr:transport protein particle (TRAPP) component domain protein [Leptospira broomii serovar Hurstbridge str. 5399]